MERAGTDGQDLLPGGCVLESLGWRGWPAVALGKDGGQTGEMGCYGNECGRATHISPGTKPVPEVAWEIKRSSFTAGRRGSIWLLQALAGLADGSGIVQRNVCEHQRDGGLQFRPRRRPAAARMAGRVHSKRESRLSWMGREVSEFLTKP